MKNFIVYMVAGILVAIGLSYLFVPATKDNIDALGAFSDPFLSIQLAPSPSAGNCLTTDGTDNAWGSCGTGDDDWSSVGWATNTPSNVLYNTEGNHVVISASDKQATTTNAVFQVWGGLSGDYFYATSTATSSLITNLRADNATVTTTFTVTPLTSALTLTGASGQFAEYAGTSCTNQMLTGLSALGAGTCETIDLTDTNITAGDALTITANDIDFDGGNAPAGALGGTWASPTVDDDGHNHTGTTLSSIDISSDTNLSADGTEIILTGDALSLGTALTFTTGTSTTSFFSALGRFTTMIIDTILKFVGASNPTVDESGETAYNTATQSLSFATSTTALEFPLYPPISFAYASSSWTGTTTEISYPTSPSFDELVTSGICYANGTGKIIVGNGTSSSTIVSLSAGTTTVAVNKRFNKNGTRIIFAIGTPSGLSTVNCKFERVYLR